ncbi:hypothetical protein HOP62_03630 [Halomonas sp. MCCC 1A17488]|uniref:Uncharacterized protein n=1 Tax=Billgrantia sulfidoxydans TaxID=2733484 RepID=A0ABX7W4E1_9GAMM|nr:MULTISPECIES: hypothetical protein [Halomonas]MCE8015165.1 hypothetical protein [Halomonas sp. MCCC 1A17488]MCG3238498.1 hypothetical protein [Halomonas sp. MCCC 1A17488]QPP47761.1 hypothetical protein I4484_10770 [Halomonas sp. SS10-MC5]QTP55068.1 hypothetical protein HNO51_10475 [Halomonas sulfidoxydans]
MLLSHRQWFVLVAGHAIGTFLFVILGWPPDANHDLFLAFGGMLVPTLLAFFGALLGRIHSRQGASVGMVIGYVIFFAPAGVVMLGR